MRTARKTELNNWNQEFKNINHKNRKYLIKTYGCQMNVHDSERIAFLLEDIGYESTENQNEADIILYNTCMIRENAEVKVYGHLGQLKPLKKERPDLIIGLCGCMMQLNDIRNSIKKKHSHVDLIFGTNNINELPDMIYKHLRDNQFIESIEQNMKIVEDAKEVIHGEVARAYINIMYGCENFCTYCVVPYVRGKETSREPIEILKEVHYLADQGFTEIMLLGQNVNSYGQSLTNPITFTDLLKQIEKVEGIKRIRFMTSHPKDCPQELIDWIAASKKLSTHIHLPVQSGSNKILKKMNRKYTREYYLDLVRRMKEKIPNLSLSTDIIVGFPGETEEDFQDTLKLVDEVGYDQGFMFIYSERPGTVAQKMPEKISRDIQLNRFQLLLDHMYDSFKKKNEAYIGKTVEILVESVSKNNPDRLSGRTDTFKLVHFLGEKNLIGKYVQIKILSANSFSLFGELVERLE